MHLSRIVALLVGIMAAPALAAHGQSPASTKSVTAEQWRQDLRFMANEMKTRHANIYHSVSAKDFDAAVADLDRRIPQLDRNQIIVRMMRIAAMVGDGHTRIDPRKDKAFGFASLPIKLYDFDDGIFIRAVGPGQEALLGARVEAVGGVPMEEARGRLAALVSADNQMAARTMVPLYLGMPDVLQAVGLSTDRRSATFRLRKGERRWTVKLASESVDPVWPPDTDVSLVTPDGWLDARRAPQPMWLQEPLTLHRLIGDPGRRFVYAQLNQGTEYKGETIDAFGKHIAELVRTQNPRALIFDVRLNYGGNGDQRHGLIRDLIRAEDDDTQLFILTARGSFSATQFYLEDLDRLSHGLLVGEPAAGKPISYGDAYRSIMPNSGIAVRTSISYWQSGQDHRPWTPIDVAVAYTFADYVAGRDPVLEAALSYRPQPSLLDRLNSASKANGPAGAAAALSAWSSDPNHRYSDVPGDGVRFIQQMDDEAAALAASRWLAERYPRHRDAQTLHALLAEAKGQKAEALSAARLSLALDPNERQARSVIERLTAESPR